MKIRNIAIIAHVDHGKTTLTDAILKQTGAVLGDVSMDSNNIEKERGITIYAKNAAVTYKDTKINIVDTPGHADFGSEVERVLRSIDSVVLVVDAQEGPMPQTRFVLKKSLELGLRPIVVLNKIDKPAADPKHTEELVYELFLDLGATDEQLNFPIIYAIGRDGVAMKKLDDERKDLTPLLDLILDHVVPTEVDRSTTFLFQPFNLAYDNFLGRLAIGRVHQGVLKMGDTVYGQKPSGEKYSGRITKIFSFSGLSKVESGEAVAGDIVMIAGLPQVYIGDTISINAEAPTLPSINIDEPTIALNFLVNNSPFAGRDGKYVTSRQLRERLERELEINVGLKIDFDGTESFRVYGRGELHISILLENMRREGYEMQVSQPQVVFKEINGQTHEPFEEVTIDAPTEFQGTIIEKIGGRGGVMTNLKPHHGMVRLTFEVPTRGLLGYRNQFTIDTKGEGIMSAQFIGFKPYAGEIKKRAVGSMASMMTGKALAYALYNLQDRGTLYIGAGTEVYEGMVIGNTSKGDEMAVNPVKAKQMTNVRNSGNDEAAILTPHFELTIERGLEIMMDDEYLEVTPNYVRLRKQFLTEAERQKVKRVS